MGRSLSLPISDFTEADVQDADRTLMGVDYAGRLGTSITVGDLNNDGENEVIAGAPYGDVNGYFGAGRVVSWQVQTTFIDEDGDGFVDVFAYGVDCDDADASIYPGQVEMTGNGIDDNCDGNIDDVVDTQPNQTCLSMTWSRRGEGRQICLILKVPLVEMMDRLCIQLLG